MRFRIKFTMLIMFGTIWDCSLGYPESDIISIYSYQLTNQNSVQFINISPERLYLEIDTTLQLQAIATYSDWSTIDITNSTGWRSEPANVLTVLPGGSITGLELGQALVIADYDVSSELSPGNSTTVTVTPSQTNPLMAIAVTPSTILLDVGGNQQFTAIGSFFDGSQVDITALVTWVSVPEPPDAEQMLTISNSVEDRGLATASGSGAAILFARYDSITSNIVPVSIRCSAPGDPAYGGIIVESTSTDCLIMENSDRAPCRRSSIGLYYNCFNWPTASTTCDAGVSIGPEWYLPTDTDLIVVKDHLGSGSPVSEQNFCVANQENCTTYAPYHPTHYWSQTAVDAYSHLVLDASQGFPLPVMTDTTANSVRCVKKITY